MRTFPLKLSIFRRHDLDLSVESTFLTIITLRIQFRIHDIIINKTDYLKNRRNVVLHIRHFYITDRTACRKRLKLGFKFQFVKRIDRLTYINVITVRDITLIRHTRNNTESFLKAFCKFVCRTLNRRTVNTETYICLLFPSVARFIHVFHYVKRKCSRRICVRFSRHIFHTFVKSGISKRDRRISAIKQIIDLLPFFQTCQRAKLPKDRSRIRKSSFQTVMSAHKSPVTKIQSLVKHFPEFVLISAGGQCYVHKVDRHNSLIKASVKLIISVFVFPRAKSASASHNREAVSFF